MKIGKAERRHSFLNPPGERSTHMSQSEVARIREQIEAEYEAAKNGLTGLAQYGRHAFINARYRRIDALHRELADVVGEQEALTIVDDINRKVIKP
jgi:hypothetical protein